MADDTPADSMTECVIGAVADAGYCWRSWWLFSFEIVAKSDWEKVLLVYLFTATHLKTETSTRTTDATIAHRIANDTLIQINFIRFFMHSSFSIRFVCIL